MIKIIFRNGNKNLKIFQEFKLKKTSISFKYLNQNI